MPTSKYGKLQSAKVTRVSFKFLKLHLCIYLFFVCGERVLPASMRMLKDNSHSAMLVPEIIHRWSGLVVSKFIHQTISLTPKNNFIKSPL